MATFDDQPTLIGERLLLRPLRADDHDGLFAAARDPRTWAGHPAKTRHLPEVFRPYFDQLLALGGTLVITLKDNGRIIGCSRYYHTDDAKDDIAIGFTFLHPEFWGGETNREMKALMLDHAFAQVDRVWFHIAPDNLRSQIATERIGASHRKRETLNLTGTPVDMLCYAIERSKAA